MILTHYKYSLWSIVWFWWHYVFIVRFWRHCVFIVWLWRYKVFVYDSDTLYVLIVVHCVILETLRIHCEIRETLRIHCVILEVLSIRVWFWHIISTHCDPLCDSGDITYSLFDYGGIKYSWMIREWFGNEYNYKYSLWSIVIFWRHYVFIVWFWMH